MKVLGIETSCDETAVAVVNDRRDILSNIVLSQQEHSLYGGVVPEVAARAHVDHLDRLVQRALDDSGLRLPDIDGIAVTAGPGLIGGVMVGVMTAKALAAVTGKPVVGVNHLEGHALTARLTDDLPFPYLLLLVSGGHCQLLVAKGVEKYQRLGSTIDDAVGEAFDKTAKMMGLGYPGGPAVEKMAALCADAAAADKKYAFPRSMRGQDNCHFSFSGLKTAVRRAVEALPAGEISRGDAADICAAFQLAVGDILDDRVARAIDIYKALNPAHPALVVAGGVAANGHLRKILEARAAQAGLRFVAPPLKLCTDNAAMIAWAGLEHLRLNPAGDALDFAVHARWPLDPDAPAAAQAADLKKARKARGGKGKKA